MLPVVRTRAGTARRGGPPRSCSMPTGILAALSLCIALPGWGGEPVFPRRNAVVAAVEKAAPAVVNISTERITVRRGDPFFEFRNPFFDDFFREYFDRFDRPRQFRSHSLGSGVIIDPEGHVVTNDHVVRKASKIHLTLADGSKHEGRLLSTDAESDLALIEVAADKPLPSIEMGQSEDLMSGETAIALGNPFGLESTVTVGVVSATNRSVMLRGNEAYAGLIQTDAAINPGNSGGALVNIHGRLIGINVAIYAEAQGIGFAIPVDRVRDAVKGLFNYRLVKKTYIGIKVRDVAPRETAALRLRDARGAFITHVEKDSPAAKAGLRAGDVIQAVDARPVADSLQFFKRMLAKSVGQEVGLRIARNGATVTPRVVVASVPRPSGAQLARRKLGLSLQPMTRELARTLGLRQPVGLLVTEVEEGGPGAVAGLARGDVVLRFGQLAINTLEQLAIVLEQISEQRVGLLLVRRGRLYRARLTTR